MSNAFVLLLTSASLLRLYVKGNDSLAGLPLGLIHAPLSELSLPLGLVPESGGVEEGWKADEVKDFSTFRSFLSLHGTLPRLDEKGSFHALPEDLRGVILTFLLVNGRRRGDGRRRLVPRGVDGIVVRALVDLERGEREEGWREGAWGAS